MAQKSIFDIISPIMVGPSSSHTAGAVRLGYMAKNIYSRKITKVVFKLYNSYAKTGKGHGTDKGLLAGILGFSVDDVNIKNVFDIANDIDYKFEYLENLNRHPNAVDMIINDEMTISGESVGGGKIKITKINDFSLKFTGEYPAIVLVYKDKPGMISMVSEVIQKKNINIASLLCDRDEKGGVAMMSFSLDDAPTDDMVENIKSLKDVHFVASVGKLKS